MDASSRKTSSLLLQAGEEAVASMEAWLHPCQPSGRRRRYDQPWPVIGDQNISQEEGELV